MSFQHLIREFAVIREEDEAHRVIFEAADWENALGDAVEKIGEGAAPFGIDHGGDDFRRLMQEKVNSLRLRAEEFALDFDVVGGFVGFAA